jgi:prolipoprotein diacylglyceryltransferase
MDLFVYKLVILKSILIFVYVFTFVILLSKIFPQYNKSQYESYSVPRLLYEIILETILLFLILLTSKCFANLVVKHVLEAKKDNEFMYYISYSLLVSIIFTTIDKSYKNKILLLRDKLL